jgi:hypothetical protein
MKKNGYTDDVFIEICGILAETAQSIESICKSNPAYPTGRTFWNRIAQDPALFQCYARAQEIAQELEDQKLGAIADGVLAGEIEPQAGRVAADIYKWRMSRKAAKRYGDKISLDSKPETPRLTDDQIRVKLLDILSRNKITVQHLVEDATITE